MLKQMKNHFIKYESLSIQYALQLKSIPYHPTHRTIFLPKYTIKFANKPTAIPINQSINQYLFQTVQRYNQ